MNAYGINSCIPCLQIPFDARVHKCIVLISNSYLNFWILHFGGKIKWLYLLSYLYNDFQQVNEMAPDDLATQDVKASNAMLLAKTSWTIRAAAPERLIKAFTVPYALFHKTAYC